MVALIPARAGSKRVPGKNTKLLAGHPLIDYTIAAAQKSGVFGAVWVCSDDDEACEIGSTAGCAVYRRSPVDAEQPDVVWVRQALGNHERWSSPHKSEAFAILRPTSPFRTADTIRRAYQQFVTMDPRLDSLRAVEPARQSPYKMWTVIGDVMRPFASGRRADGTPYHSSPTQTLPRVYAQNASLEMSWTRNIERGSISGHAVAPFFTIGYEGFDINEPRDWREAEYLIASGEAVLPEVQGESVRS